MEAHTRKGREPCRRLRSRWVARVYSREDVEGGNHDANDDNSVDREEQRLRISHFFTPFSPRHLYQSMLHKSPTKHRHLSLLQNKK